MKPHVLVTGATGYVGRALTRRLIAAGREVHALVRPSPAGDRLEDGILTHPWDGGLESVEAAVTSAATAGPPAVFHLAAASGIGGQAAAPEEILAPSVTLSAQLAAAGAPLGASLVNVGSYWQYDASGAYRPNTLYAAAKEAGQRILDYYAERADLRVVTIIMFDVYGPGDWRPKLLPRLVETALTGEAIDASPGDQLIDWVYIDDAVEALLAGERYLQTRASEGGHRRFGAHSGRQQTLKEIVAQINQVTGREIPVRWGTLPYPPHQIMKPVNNLERAPGWTPRISTEQGLLEMWGQLKAGRPQANS